MLYSLPLRDSGIGTHMQPKPRGHRPGTWPATVAYSPLGEDGQYFATRPACQYDPLQALGEHFDELHIVGLTSRGHLTWNARHVYDH